ncbi:MAG: hypothetical protein AAFX58_00990 [Pseudomonadota bacterium]
MFKVITGFLLGVVVTLVVVYWLDERSSEVRPTQTDHSSPREEPAELDRASPVNRTDNTAGDDGANSYASTAVEAVSEEEPSVLQSQSIVVPQQGAKSVNSGQGSSATTANNQYPPEIAEMIENRVDEELQARYENDEREESWATYMEGQLTAYFSQKPQLEQFYISLIDCRTSVCSIHALGYGPDALTRWNTATADLVSRQWFDFNNMSMNRRNPEPDILAVVLILTREPPG